MNFWENKRVLVTGGSGLIGSHLIGRLIGLGADVHALEHVNPVMEAQTVYAGDITRMDQVITFVRAAHPDIVFHLASQAIVGDGESSPVITLETNIQGSQNLLLALKTHAPQCKAVIVASTDKVFGRHHSLPYTEEHALLGVEQVYETSKHCEDILAQMAAHSWGMPIGITRFGNVYGPGDRNFSRLIPGAIKSYTEKFGFPTLRSDGQHYRDFVFVDDVVEGYLRLAMYVEANPGYSPHIFNFGTGIPSRVLDVVVMISEHFPNSLPPHVMYGAEDEIRKQYVSSGKAAEFLGWSAKTRLKDGIQKTVDWYKEHLHEISN